MASTSLLLNINLVFLIAGQCVEAASPLVTLPTGKVEGHYKKSDNGRVIYAAFEGIPYARSPVGKYRFEESKPMKPWYGTWQAKTLSKCMQYYHYTKPGDDYVLGEEDCLHVNVYTPQVNDGKFRDVIVYIHGGAFMFNHGATYGERFLMNHNIVFVTFNYRLGPLGFLSTEDNIVPGNTGLKDQLLALRWIKANVRYFGGNPDSITLSGMSAGGASVHLHTLSPRTRNAQLFTRVIAQSGTALNPWVMTENSREKAIKLGSLVGCPTHDIKEMIKCMKYRPARPLVNAVKYFQPWLYNPFSPFGIVVDKGAEFPFLSEHPYETLKKKLVLDVPIIFSNVQAEGLYPSAEFVLNNHLEEINIKWNDIIPFVLDYNNTVAPADIVEVSQKIRKFYVGESKVSIENFPKIVQMITDRLFLSDGERAVRMHAAAATEPIYYYYYSYKAANSKADSRTHSKENYGVCHGDDTIMILSTNVVTNSTRNDATMCDIMQNMWLSYAKNGVPKVGNLKWESVLNDVDEPLKYLHIKTPQDLEMVTAEYLGNRVNFWDSLPIVENHNIPNARDEL